MYSLVIADDEKNICDGIRAVGGSGQDRSQPSAQDHPGEKTRRRQNQKGRQHDADLSPFFLFYHSLRLPEFC